MTPKNPRAASWEAAWLPRRPLSGREKSGPYRRRPRDEALTDPLIEANPLVKKSLVIVDVDTTEIEGLTTLLGRPTSPGPSDDAAPSGPDISAGHSPPPSA